MFDQGKNNATPLCPPCLLQQLLPDTSKRLPAHVSQDAEKSALEERLSQRLLFSNHPDLLLLLVKNSSAPCCSASAKCRKAKRHKSGVPSQATAKRAAQTKNFCKPRHALPELAATRAGCCVSHSTHGSQQVSWGHPTSPQERPISAEKGRAPTSFCSFNIPLIQSLNKNFLACNS